MFAASASFASTTSTDPVIKVVLERGKQTEMRRIRGQFSYEELCNIVRHMWNSAPKHLIIEYDDEDGDRVRIGSELEWSEAQQHASERKMSALKIHARRAPSAKDATDSEGSDVDHCDAPAAVPPTALPPAAAADVAPNSTKPPVPQLTTAKTVETAAPQLTAAMLAQQQDTANTIDLLSRLYDCDAAVEMSDMFSKVDFAPVVTRRVDGVAQEVHVDIDRIALRRMTVDRTNAWIGKGLFEKAETTLEAALLVWPEDSVLEYNLACSSSLRGDLSKSMEMLRSAVSHGFRNTAQLRTDPDLANVRDHPDFGSLIRGSSQTASREVIDVDASEPAVPADKGRVVSAEVASIIAMFPQLTVEQAEALLVAHCGSVRGAVNSLLGGR